MKKITIILLLFLSRNIYASQCVDNCKYNFGHESRETLACSSGCLNFQNNFNSTAAKLYGPPRPLRCHEFKRVIRISKNKCDLSSNQVRDYKKYIKEGCEFGRRWYLSSLPARCN